MRFSHSSDFHLVGLGILLVEPEMAIAEVVTFLLESEGARVYAAPGIHKATHIMAQEQPDVILCNVALPDGDAYSFIADVIQARSQSGMIECNSGPKAIAIASDAWKVDRERAIKAGFQHFLFEPTEYSSLIAAIKRLTA